VVIQDFPQPKILLLKLSAAEAQSLAAYNCSPDSLARFEEVMERDLSERKGKRMDLGEQMWREIDAPRI